MIAIGLFAAELPSPAARRVDFTRDVQPLLMAKCTACHTGSTAQAGLRLHTRAELLKGGHSLRPVHALPLHHHDPFDRCS